MQAETPKPTAAELDAALQNLRTWYPKGSTVYTILRAVSRSGMSRTIGLVSLQQKLDEGSPLVRHSNWAAASVLKLRWIPGDGVRIQGCGMDMGFELAYRLGVALYGDGYALKHQWI